MNEYSQGIIDKLKAMEPILRQEYGIKRLRVFGSVARGDANRESDVDLIADYDKPLDYDLFFDTREAIERSLQAPIDFMTEDSIKDAFKPYIQKDARDIYS